MNALGKFFPRYTTYDPKVPVWCLTLDTPGCIHRFFDTCPISPSGRYLAVFQLPFEDRQPLPGETGTVRVVDLETGENKAVSETRGWEPQMGANLNWGGSDSELFFNDVDTETWQPFAWKLDLHTGEKEKMEGSVYHASPDGTWLISSNLTRTRKTQPGYGVAVPEKTVDWRRGAPDDDGFFLTDTRTGQCRLFASIRELLTDAEPVVGISPDDDIEISGFHSKFNPQGTRVMLSLRWFKAGDKPQWDMFSNGEPGSVCFAWVTADMEKKHLHCAVGPEEWDKGGHHATWFPDGERISMNLNIDREVMRFVQVNWDGTGYGKILDNAVGSGHPTLHPDSPHILTDTYIYESSAFGDGTIPLRWIHLEDGTEEPLVRINTQTGCKDGVMRVDPHPAWCREWRYVVFNAFEGGTRRVFLADMKNVL